MPIRILANLPSRDNFLFRMPAYILLSILPPQIIEHIFLFLNNDKFSIIAVTPAAPAPSEIILSYSNKLLIVFSIEISSTNIISSIYSLIIGKVFSPGVLTAIPSAIVSPEQNNFFFLNLL